MKSVHRMVKEFNWFTPESSLFENTNARARASVMLMSYCRGAQKVLPPQFLLPKQTPQPPALHAGLPHGGPPSPPQRPLGCRDGRCSRATRGRAKPPPTRRSQVLLQTKPKPEQTVASNSAHGKLLPGRKDSHTLTRTFNLPVAPLRSISVRSQQETRGRKRTRAGLPGPVTEELWDHEDFPFLLAL